MTARFIRTPGEGIAGEYVDQPCHECGDLHCECDEYSDPESLRRWMALTEDERKEKLAAAQAQIDAAFAHLRPTIERDLRRTIEMQRKDAA